MRYQEINYKYINKSLFFIDNLMYKNCLVILSISILLSACSQKEQNGQYQESRLNLIYYRSTDGWEFSGTDPSNGAYALIQNQNFPIYTGSIIFADFIDTLKIKTLKLQRPKKNTNGQLIEYKLYLNQKYAGKFKENKIIKIANDIQSVRIEFVKTRNEKIIRAWDSIYYYSMIKDTSNVGLTDISIKFNIDTAGKQIFEFRKKGQNIQNAPDDSTLQLIEKFARKPFILVKKNRSSGSITEQIVCIDKLGKFQINQMKFNPETKKPESDIFFRGKFHVLQNSENQYKFDLEGSISGLPNALPDKEYNYSSIADSDPDGIKIDGFPDKILLDFPEWAMINIKSIDNTIRVDIPYAGTNNVAHQELYTCNKCFLRYVTLKKILKIRKLFNLNGLDIKMWDCYRPYHVQKLLYEVFPVKGYVADPNGGSIHNRGTAVDITLTDMNGNQLDMGSGYDDFSGRSHLSYKNLPDSILKKRQLLHETMLKNGFLSIKMEWWHFEMLDARKYPILNDPFPCDDAW
jgi:zinc D-Ala-D-Ala dipeptidase